jgi:protein-arginine kinase activator protein McsA
MMVGKVKQELKDNINSMKRKIENAQKSYDNLVSEKRDEDSAANIPVQFVCLQRSFLQDLFQVDSFGCSSC